MTIAVNERLKEAAHDKGFDIRIDKYCAVEDVSGCGNVCMRGHDNCAMTKKYIVTFIDRRKAEREPGKCVTHEYDESELDYAGQRWLAHLLEHDGRVVSAEMARRAKDYHRRRQADADAELKDHLTPDWGDRHPPSKHYGRLSVDMGGKGPSTGCRSEEGDTYDA